MAPIEVSVAPGSSGDQVSPADLFSSSLVSAYVDDRRFVARPWLLDPAQLLAERAPTARIVILVDALDEIRRGVSGETIRDWLTACPELPANIRIVLSSRPDADLLRTFRDNKAREITELVLDPEAELDRAASPRM